MLLQGEIWQQQIYFAIFVVEGTCLEPITFSVFNVGTVIVCSHVHGCKVAFQIQDLEEAVVLFFPSTSKRVYCIVVQTEILKQIVPNL